MRKELHPEFAHLDNREAAEAFSELPLHLDLFKVAAEDESPAEEGFPPERAYMGMVAAAYITDGGLVSRQAYPMIDDERVQAAFVDSYTRIVGSYQAYGQKMQKSRPVETQWMASRAITCARNAGLRTVASFSTFQSASDNGTMYSGLAIPRVTYETIPLEIRDELIPLIASGTIDDETRAELSPLLQRTPQAGDIALAAASLHMPTPEQITAVLAA
jgi:hypothetical protein